MMDLEKYFSKKKMRFILTTKVKKSFEVYVNTTGIH